MAQQQQKAAKQQDPYVSRGKALTSAVQRLRGWVGSDPTRAAELADALVELTEHRLLGHAYATAAADAQDSVRFAAQLLTANGPIGPYTASADGARYLTAIVHVATIQAGVGLPEAAGRTMASWHESRRQFDDVALEVRLDPTTEVWGLLGDARTALAAGEIAAANAAADAALQRWTGSGLADEVEQGFVPVDVAQLVSDARWAARQEVEALGYLLAAKAAYDSVTGDRLREPDRLAPAVLERLIEPASELYGRLADRLSGLQEIDLALSVRRDLIALLRSLRKKLGEPARVTLAAALADLAGDLVLAGRRDEAETAAAQAAGLVEMSAAGPVEDVLEAVLAQEALQPRRVSIERALAPVQLDENASDARRLDAERRRQADVWSSEERPRAVEREQRLRAEVLDRAEQQLATRRAADQAAAAREAAERKQAERVAQAEAERVAAAVEAERQERKRRREERLEAHRRELEAREAERLAAEREEWERRERQRRAADPAQLEQLELEQLEAELAELERVEAERERAEQLEAERVEAKRVEAERVEAERVEADRVEADRRAEQERVERERAEQLEAERVEAERVEAERVEAERVEAERVEAERAEQERAERERAEQLEAERVEAERVEAERVEAERAEQERAERERVQQERAQQERAERERVQQERAQQERQEREELVDAMRSWDEFKARGDRRGARAANERVVELLRTRAETDLAQYGPQLLSALEELSRARLRGGDLFGSRAPAREARALAKALGQ